MTINDTFTSTGAKFFAHEEAMRNLRNGKGQCVVTTVMITDICQHTCAFCSVQARAGDSLLFDDIMAYLDILQHYGLKSVILSGGGNPILYKCKESHRNFNDVVDAIHARGLEIGLITNGMPLKEYQVPFSVGGSTHEGYSFVINTTKPRQSWKTVHPDVLDKLTWVRISMSGLDHDEGVVYVPDVNPEKTTLGFSYVAHDLYIEPADPHHGKVSTKLDLVSGDRDRRPDRSFESRTYELVQQITLYVSTYQPRYVRLLPNCLEPPLIPWRCRQLEAMAYHVNQIVGSEVVFVQHKPPKAPHACYLGYIHPVLNCDGWVYPCDSCVLNEAAGHSFANPWRVCRWQDVASIYDKPVRSLIADPSKTCPGCVFFHSNTILEAVRDGTVSPIQPIETLEHINFV